mgnify:CR=1 FL=1
MLKDKSKNLNFPKLPYSFDALEPNIDAQTMELHYTKHHKGYHTKFLNAIKGTDAEDMEFEKVLNNISNFPAGVRNNGGGHYNHSLFWTIMSPDGGGKPEGSLLKAIENSFGSFESFKEKFETAAKGRFGSGWAWLMVKDDKSLAITDTPNQDNPLMDNVENNGMPIMGLDVWEHAYYLKYQNRRPDYISAFWNVVNWNKVNEYYNDNI